MNKIIALKGRGNSGKTTTINMVFDFLVKKYPNAHTNILKPRTSDIKAIITINGTKIGIESQGDPNSRLKQSLKDFHDDNCEIIICATRTSGMTTDWVKNYSNLYKIKFLKQKYTESAKQMQTNLETCQKIITEGGL